ncbi:MAG: hypothetical protein R2862_03625 [Thermoanaerobaculia bacterium]
MRVRFAEQDRASLEELADFSVPTAGGETVALGALTDVTWLPTSQQIWRSSRRTTRRSASIWRRRPRRRRAGACPGWCAESTCRRESPAT